MYEDRCLTIKICFSNKTDVDEDSTVSSFVFAQPDVDVANCLTNLDYVQADACISTSGSSCDIDGYMDNGGYIKNARTPTGASGTSEDNRLSADQSSAVQAVFSLLLNQNIDIVNDMPEVYFWSNDGKNTPIYSDYQLNLGYDALNC